jgi:uncharacterized membrane protein YqgA involved in biofilm formation
VVGTLINVAAILFGGFIGLFFGTRIPSKFRQTIIHAVGLFTLCYAVFIFAKTQNFLIPLGSLVIGTVLGEWWKIEERLDGLGERLRQRFDKQETSQQGIEGELETKSRFVDGFVSASLLFCIGPMAILGSIQDGLTGDFQMLAIKSVLDCIAAIAFAATLGPGVLFSALIILVYQGSISLIAKFVGVGFNEAAVNEMTSVGGIILAGIAISSLLELKKIRTGSFLPALFIAVLLVYALKALDISF